MDIPEFINFLHIYRRLEEILENLFGKSLNFTLLVDVNAQEVNIQTLKRQAHHVILSCMVKTII